MNLILQINSQNVEIEVDNEIVLESLLKLVGEEPSLMMKLEKMIIENISSIEENEQLIEQGDINEEIKR